MSEPRILYLEPKGGQLAGPGRIGRVEFSKSGRTLRYRGRSLQSLEGYGYKANYRDVASGDYWWVSGPKQNGQDTLYPAVVEIDDDVRVEYWTEIRGRPDLVGHTTFRSEGKYSWRRPHPVLGVRGTARGATRRR